MIKRQLTLADTPAVAVMIRTELDYSALFESVPGYEMHVIVTITKLPDEVNDYEQSG